MIQIKPNANFYSLGGTSIHKGISKEYEEYRKCWHEYPSNFIMRDFPMHLDIEITSRCNLKCTFCDKLSYVTKENLGDMDFALFRKIIDEGAERGLWAVKLSYRGEPLLHKDLVKMIAYAKEKGIIDVYFNTNGMLLDTRLCNSLIDAELDRISISVEGTDPDEFNRQRVGADFHRIMKNIETLMEIRRRSGSNKPKVRVQTVYFSGLNAEEYKAFWAPRCDEVAAVDYKDGSHRKKGIIREWACPQLWQRMTIQWDGVVLACNNDDLCLLADGNVKDKTIYECWHGKNAEKARRLHMEGRSHEVSACDGCPWRTAQILKKESEPK